MDPILETTDTTPFDGIPPPLAAALEKRGFAELTAVQRAVQAAGGARDLRISSQTGSGKTVALGLVMAPALIAAVEAGGGRLRGPRALVITPTRELAMQVRGELDWLFAGLRGLGTDCVTGGTSVRLERRRLDREPAILAGTPGRLLDHIRSGVLDCSRIAHLVLDEADQMLDMGFRDELEGILAHVPAERRTHLVSATFPEAVRRLTERYQDDPLPVEGTRLGVANADIEHVGYTVHGRDRYGALVNLLLLAGGKRSLVFVRTRAETTEVAERLAKDGFAALALSGEMPQAQRTRTMNAFRLGTARTLVATDVAARGLDVADISSVIHYSPPHDADAYTHRSGRTGRAGQQGRSVSLVSPAGRRRMELLLRDAKVSAAWRAVPGAATVREQLKKTARRRLFEALDRESPSEAQLDDARGLLADRDPAAVVAALVARCEPEPPCEPADVDVPEVRNGRNGRNGAARDGGNGRRDGAQRFERFFINWGAREGATARRVLAHVCRRGDVQGQDVGAIDIRHSLTRFDVAAGVARAFEARVRRPDPRQPDLRIKRDRHGGRRNGQHGSAS